MKTSSAGAKGYRRLFPSLTALVQFEAVARLQSFTQAADELGVTQAAISKQVKGLEESLGLALFVRQHRAIKLTAEGAALFVAVSGSMQRIAAVFDQLTHGKLEQEIVLATTAAFSHFRLLPRLTELRRDSPELHLRLTTQMFTADLRGQEVDLAVRYGHGKWRDGSAIWLFDEEVFPVCSPQWLDAHPGPWSLQALADSALIDYDATSEGWLGWDEWFRSLGIHRPRLKYSLRCSLYTDAVQAALHGQGVTLGWKQLLKDEMAAGKLIRLTDGLFRPEESYYAVIPNGRSLTPAAQTLIDWIRREPPGA